MDGQELCRGGNPDPDQVHARGRARLPGALPPAPRAPSTPCRRARRSTSSCSCSAGFDQLLSRSPAASATRTAAPTASRSSPSATSRCRFVERGGRADAWSRARLQRVFRDGQGHRASAAPWSASPGSDAMDTYGSDKPDTPLRHELINDCLGRGARTAASPCSRARWRAAARVRGINAKGLAAKISRKEIDALGEFVKTYQAPRAWPGSRCTAEGGAVQVARSTSSSPRRRWTRSCAGPGRPARRRALLRRGQDAAWSCSPWARCACEIAQPSRPHRQEQVRPVLGHGVPAAWSTARRRGATSPCTIPSPSGHGRGRGLAGDRARTRSAPRAYDLVHERHRDGLRLHPHPLAARCRQRMFKLIGLPHERGPAALRLPAGRLQVRRAPARRLRLRRRPPHHAADRRDSPCATCSPSPRRPAPTA